MPLLRQKIEIENHITNGLLSRSTKEGNMIKKKRDILMKKCEECEQEGKERYFFSLLEGERKKFLYHQKMVSMFNEIFATALNEEDEETANAVSDLLHQHREIVEDWEILHHAIFIDTCDDSIDNPYTISYQYAYRDRSQKKYIGCQDFSHHLHACPSYGYARIKGEKLVSC